MKTFIIKLKVIHSKLMLIANVKAHAGAIRRVAAPVLIAFVLTFSIPGIDAYAHTPHDGVQALGVSPEFATDKTLFLAVAGPLTSWRFQDILRSTNGGTTWTNIPNGMDHPFKFTAIRVSPSFGNDNTVFAATRGGGIYQSLDRGDSWQHFNTGLSDLALRVLKLEIAGSKGAEYVLFAADVSGALFRRSKTQANWVQVQAKSNVAVIAVSPGFTVDGTAITADATGSLRISTDGGNNWNNLGNPASAIVHDIAIAPGDGQEIFLATSKGIFYRENSSSTFAKKVSNLPAEAVNNIAVSPDYLTDHTVFCTTVTRSVYKSTNGGDSWTLYRSGAGITNQTTALNEFSELQVSNKFSTDHSVFLSAYAGLFISGDGGITWKEKQTRLNLLTGLALSPNFITDHRVIATSYTGTLYTSANSGTTWAKGSWPNRSRLNTFDAGFVQNSAGIPKAISATAGQWGISGDYGNTWTVKFFGSFPDISTAPVSPTVQAISPNFNNDREIYFGTRVHGILQTLDGGAHWRTMRGVPSSPQITSLAISPNYTNDGTAFAANYAGTVWRTTDGGDSWLRIGASSIVSLLGPAEKYIWIAISPDFASDQLVLAGTNKGIYRSSNGGDDWTPLINDQIGPSDNVIQQIVFSPNFRNDRIVYVHVRGRGLYRVNLKLGSNGWEVASAPQNVGQWLLEHNIEFTEFHLSPGFAQDATLLGATRDTVYISKDGGLNWTEAGDPTP